MIEFVLFAFVKKPYKSWQSTQTGPIIKKKNGLPVGMLFKNDHLHQKNQFLKRETCHNIMIL